MNLDWDEIKEKMKEAIELKKDENKKIVTIKIKADIQENEMVTKMFSGSEELKQTLNQFVGKGEPIECDVKFNEEEKTMVLENFQDKKITKEVYDFFHELFFGDFLKNLIEQMTNAFKEMGEPPE